MQFMSVCVTWLGVHLTVTAAQHSADSTNMHGQVSERSAAAVTVTLSMPAALCTRSGTTEIHEVLQSLT